MKVQLARLLWAGPLTVMASVAVVLLLRAGAIALLHPGPRFAPLQWIPPIVDTVVLVTSAVLVFAAVGRFSSTPAHTYRRIAAIALIVSFWPDVALARGHWFGGGWPEAFALMTMHVASWALCTTLLPALTIVRADDGART